MEKMSGYNAPAMDEKRDEVTLPLIECEESHAQFRQRSARAHVRSYCASILILASLVWWATWSDVQPSWTRHSHTLDLSSACQQVDPLLPKLQTTGLEALDARFSSADFRNASIKRLSDIVQIPSVSYDNMGDVGEDDRFDIFYDIAAYLEKTFPRVHSELKKEKVNTHGLLFTWKGSDESLKPTVLMAHQDVVPVEQSTIDTWTHPPFSGYYDGKYVWGRGSSDCKNQLIAILEAVETLLESGYKPTRTVLLSFGFDEEVSGTRGAGTLAPRIQETYGKDSIAAIVDEGGGWTRRWGSLYATPAVGEKGYTDVHITVRMPGGHSSIPSPHTSIGVLSELITLIEKHRYSPYLADENPYIGALQCGAKYSESFPKKLKHLLARRMKGAGASSPNTVGGCHKSKHLDLLAEAAAEEDLGTRYLMQTSQAVDLISGGAKVNALPEKVEAVVNHRVNIGEHPTVPQKRIARLAAHVAKAHNLTLIAYPSRSDKIPGKTITLTLSDTTLEPAPSTPLDIYVPGTSHLSPWDVLSGTTRSLYTRDGAPVNMAPALTTGNTDTRYYWDLSRHIFRYNPGYDEEDTDGGLGNIHTVDERQSVTAHINSVRWFSRWIRNVDEAKF